MGYTIKLPKGSTTAMSDANGGSYGFDTMVILVDSRTGRVQAVQRFDQNLGHWIGPGKTFSYTTDDNGKTTLEILSLALVPAPGR
jgi:hypothetical protein